jgi:hypothetical protein
LRDGKAVGEALLKRAWHELLLVGAWWKFRAVCEPISLLWWDLRENNGVAFVYTFVYK